VEAGRSSVLVVNIEKGSPAFDVFGEFRDQRTQVNANDPQQKDAKSVTTALRLGGISQLLSIANDITQEVGDGCGVEGGVAALTQRGFEYAAAAQRLLFSPHAGGGTASTTSSASSSASASSSSSSSLSLSPSPSLVDDADEDVARRGSGGGGGGGGTFIWNKNNDLESVLPNTYRTPMSLVSAERAVRLANRFEAISKALTPKQGARNSPTAKTALSSVAAALKNCEIGSASGRFLEVVQYMVTTPFLNAELNKIHGLLENKGKALRLRSSTRQGTTHENELGLLGELNQLNCFKVVVRKTGGGHQYFVTKKPESAFDQTEKIALAEQLSNYDLDIDQYFSYAVMGDIEQEIPEDSKLSSKEITTLSKKIPGLFPAVSSGGGGGKEGGARARATAAAVAIAAAASSAQSGLGLELTGGGSSSALTSLTESNVASSQATSPPATQPRIQEGGAFTQMRENESDEDA